VRLAALSAGLATQMQDMEAAMVECPVRKLYLIGACSCLFWCSVPSSALGQQPNAEPMTNVVAVVEPVNPIASSAETKVSATLHLINQGSSAVKVRLEGHPLTLKGSAAVASFTFPDRGGTDAVNEVELPSPPRTGLPVTVDVSFTVVGMTSAGSYEGSIDVVALPAQAQRTRLLLTVTRQPSSFDPILRGTGVVNGVLTFKPLSATDSTFWLTVENPKGGSDIGVVVSAPGGLLTGQGNPVSIMIEPNAFRLVAGSAQPVALTLKQVDASGALAGKLLVSDANNSGAKKDLDVVVQPAFTACADIVKIILLVFAGTSLSLLVGTVVPIMINRQNAWRRLASLTGKIESAAERGSAAQLALRAQLHRIDFLAHDVWWFSTRAADTLADIGKETDEFERRVDMVAKANDLRVSSRESGTVPFSVVPGIERLLDEVVKKAIAGNLTDAQKTLDQVQKQIDDAGVAASLQKALAAQITALPASAAMPQTADPGMLVKLDALKAQMPLLANPLELEALLQMDRDCFAAHLYFVRYLQGVMPQRATETAYIDIAKVLLLELKNGIPGLWRASDLVQSLELGVLPQDIKAACDAQAGIVVAIPTEPVIYELVEFHFDLSDPRLNESPLVKSLALQWTFDDGTSPAQGLRCIHFFKASGFGARWRKAAVIRNVQATLGDVPFRLPVRVQGVGLRGALIARAEVFSTLTVFGGAIALALITHQGDFRSLGTVQDYINPFLWGFGLDQMKGLVSKR
jgi:hypothetical protein